ncbi:cytochrome c biogenesis CcdA family protein [Intestinibacter sp.]
MNYILLFLEGILTFVSPCILPMVPIYISYFMGQDSHNNRKRALINSLGFVLGFTITFVLLGVGASAIGLSLNKHMREMNIIAGLLMVFMGLHYLGILKIQILQRTFRLKHEMNEQNITLVSSILFGMVFSVGWTPCVGPFLGSALMIAASSSHIISGILLLLTYSLGFGIPFILSALLIDSLKLTFDFIKRNYRVINKISGITLIIAGLLMMTGYLNVLLSVLSFGI